MRVCDFLIVALLDRKFESPTLSYSIGHTIQQALDMIGPFGSFGLKNASISIEATTNPDLTLVISGSPNIPSVTADTPEVAKFFIDLLSNINFELTGQITRDALSVRLGAHVNMASDSSLVSFENAGLFFNCEFYSLVNALVVMLFS